MTDPEFFAIIFFVITILVSRFLNEKANRHLDEQARSALIDVFAGFRFQFLIPIVVIILSFFLFIKLYPDRYRTISLIYFGLLVVYMAGTNIITFRKMKALDLPLAYTRTFIASKAVMYAGLGVFVYFVAIQSLR
ncbi:MAG TPA: hypothetical protein PK200_08185 [Spirochaetota bacterium]|nr:hypothetical protein [Spirochaetota bacterium]HQO00804.1 hypothetical protein [Spirochaetota bacterium]